MSLFDNKPLNTFSKTYAKNLKLAKNLVFHKQKYGGRSDETLNVAKTSMI